MWKITSTKKADYCSIICLLLVIVVSGIFCGCGAKTKKHDFSTDLSSITDIRFDMTKDDVVKMEEESFGNKINVTTQNDHGDDILTFAEGHHVYCFNSLTGELLFFSCNTNENFSDDAQEELLKKVDTFVPAEIEKDGTKHWYGTIGAYKCEILTITESFNHYLRLDISTGGYDSKTREWVSFD